MRFDLTTLHLVQAIADTRSITRGAERESLALAAASKRLSDLEARLGVSLFDRRARGVEPTEAGRALLRHIRSLNASLHALESEVVEFSRGIRGHLRVAANASAIAEHLPADLAAFAQAHPGIRVSLEEQTSADVQVAVAEGRADVGIFIAPAVEPALDCRAYRQGELAILVPRGHVLARQPAHAFDALLDFDIVGLHAGAAAQAQMLADLKDGTIGGYCVGAPWLDRAIRDGHGIAVAGDLAIWPGHPGKVLGLREDWAIAYPNTNIALTKALLEACRYCADPAHWAELSELLSDRRYLGIKPEMIRFSEASADVDRGGPESEGRCRTTCSSGRG